MQPPSDTSVNSLRPWSDLKWPCAEEDVMSNAANKIMRNLEESKTSVSFYWYQGCLPCLNRPLFTVDLAACRLLQFWIVTFVSIQKIGFVLFSLSDEKSDMGHKWAKKLDLGHFWMQCEQSLKCKIYVSIKITHLKKKSCYHYCISDVFRVFPHLHWNVFKQIVKVSKLFLV